MRAMLNKFSDWNFQCIYFLEILINYKLHVARVINNTSTFNSKGFYLKEYKNSINTKVKINIYVIIHKHVTCSL